jgi:hypothetical protein
MQDPNAKTVQEKKPVKRIGVVSWFDGEIGRRLEVAVKNRPELLDTNRFSFADRARILLDEYGIAPSRRQVFENITPTVGFAVLTKALSGNLGSVDEIGVNVHALGNGSTPPDASDTTLEGEVARVLLASRSYSGAKAYYTAFYGLAEAVGTHTEMGLFMDADEGTPDDGTLWDRSLTSITKTGIQSLTIDYEDEFSNDV